MGLPNPRTHPTSCGAPQGTDDAGRAWRICDPSSFLSDSYRQSLNERLIQLERDSHASAIKAGAACGTTGPKGAELAVAIVGSLSDAGTGNVNQVSRQVFNQWGIGHEGCNNGVLLFLAINDRKSSIKTGSGAQALVNDRMASAVLKGDQLKRKLRDADYDAAVEHAVSILEGPLASYSAPFEYSFIGYYGITIACALCVLTGVSYIVYRQEQDRKHNAERKAEFERKLANLHSALDARKKSDNGANPPCAICLEPMPDATFETSEVENGLEILSCGHCFHADCIQEWLSRNQSCPVCRRANPRCSGKYQHEAGGNSTRNHEESYWMFARSRLFEDYSDVPGVERAASRVEQTHWEDQDLSRIYYEEVSTMEREAAEREVELEAQRANDDNWGGGNCDSGGGADGDW